MVDWCVMCACVVHVCVPVCCVVCVSVCIFCVCLYVFDGYVYMTVSKYIFMLSVCMYICVCVDTFIRTYINIGMSVIHNMCIYICCACVWVHSCEYVVM